MIKWYDGYKKRKDQKSKKKRRVNAYCLAPQSCDGLVYVKRREGVVEVIDSRFKIIWYAEIKNVLIKDVEIWSKIGYD